MADTPNMQDWEGPGLTGGQRVRHRWRNLVWALIFPRREQHMVPTVSGVLLITVSLGIGSAAYNSSNNILFITLSLLLACLILSGVLSWFNFSRIRWRLLFPPVARAGQKTTLSLELVNGKKLLPTYGLECLVTASPALRDGPALPQTTFTAKGQDVKAIFRHVPEEVSGRLRLIGRLDPEDTVQLDWDWLPPHRGRWEIALRNVGSFFPFGFFNKKLSARLVRDLTVWPAPVDYQQHQANSFRWAGMTSRTARAGSGSDLLALRRYSAGDSHRLINWKASARTGQLLVRQFAAETTESYSLQLWTDAVQWPRPEQFERFISFVATLAEDFFRVGSLRSAAIDDHAMRPIRHVRDYEALLDELAELQPRPAPTVILAGSAAPFHVTGNLRNVITFLPEGNLGVIALIDGEKTATA